MENNPYRHNLPLQCSVFGAAVATVYYFKAEHPTVIMAIALGFFAYAMYPILYLIFGFLRESWNRE